MINAIKLASEFLESLPKDTLSPETTEKREGYVHPVGIEGNETLVTLKFIIRDFDAKKLKEYESLLKSLVEKTVANYKGAGFDFQVIEQYRNMKYILDDHPEVQANAEEALKRLNVLPLNSAIRGGTDGSRLSYMGLPTPNLFAGGHNFHAFYEYVAIQDMEMAVKMIVTLAQVWEEKA
jgi:tripeptide aminopeptidase